MCTPKRLASWLIGTALLAAVASCAGSGVDHNTDDHGGDGGHAPGDTGGHGGQDPAGSGGANSQGGNNNGGASGGNGTGGSAGNGSGGASGTGGAANGGSGGMAEIMCPAGQPRCECHTAKGDGVNIVIDDFEDANKLIAEIDDRRGEWFGSGAPADAFNVETTSGGAPESTKALHVKGAAAAPAWPTFGV